jgi:uncharacterized protein
MTKPLQIPQKDRVVIVDVVRGFALTGVLIANFTSYVSQQTPEPILNSISTSLDTWLVNINAIFIEWKFMTLFSILFGYGFGLILESLEKKGINSTLFFAKRMFWLFVFGVLHTMFWWADVLNLYAMSGIALLLFKKKSNQTVLFFAILFTLIIPASISYMLRNQPETFTDEDIIGLYSQYKHGSLLEVFSFNLNFYYRMFIVSGSDLHDIIETLGRFLFGYFLLRINFFHSVETRKAGFGKIAMFAFPLMLAYFIVKWMLIDEIIHVNQFVLSPLLSLGVLSTVCFYVCVLVLSYISVGSNRFFTSLQALGRMTLTSYLLVSAFLIILLYGFGFGRLGELPMRAIWLYAVVWLLAEIVFSTYWLKYFRYGPTEWIWRQLTFWKRLQLRKS